MQSFIFKHKLLKLCYLALLFYKICSLKPPFRDVIPYILFKKPNISKTTCFIASYLCKFLL